MKNIGIIGGGFSGILSAIQLIKKAESPFRITLISDKASFCRGKAYQPYSSRHLLNVPAEKMSAFPDQPFHFLDWVVSTETYPDLSRAMIGKAFLPRELYGQYLETLWRTYERIAVEKGIQIHIIYDHVEAIYPEATAIRLHGVSGKQLQVDMAVLATGNALPNHPKLGDHATFHHVGYFRDPWKPSAVRNLKPTDRVLILGNGLSMVDTVIGLVENGGCREIVALSPHGYNMLPQRHNQIKYMGLANELELPISLRALFTLVNKHIKLVRKQGLLIESVTDSLRPFSQLIWQHFSDEEKALFMQRFRHRWGAVRHRLPLEAFDLIQSLRLTGKLTIAAGRLQELKALSDQSMTAIYFDKVGNKLVTKTFSRVINCTGPGTDLSQIEMGVLKRGYQQGIFSQDALKLGIRADPGTFKVQGTGAHTLSNEIYVIGPLLKGELWESTAISEIRLQAEALAARLLSTIEAKASKSESSQAILPIR